MQIMNPSMPTVVARNIRPTSLATSFYSPDYIQPDHSTPQPPPLQKYQLPQNLENHQDHAESDCLLQRNGYSIHLVNSFKQRIKATTLIKRMYASRGYQTESSSVFSISSNQYTFEARQSGQLVGTLTLTIDDTEKGLLADTLYQTELDQFRQKGRKLCEVSKLAFCPESSSKEIFASIFHMAYIFAHRIHGADDAFIEINPRHAAFYKRMLGFQQIGELRTCPRVNAPAVLLHLDLGYMKEKITTQAGQLNQKTRSIYPYFLSINKEREIIDVIQTPILPTARKMNPGH